MFAASRQQKLKFNSRYSRFLKINRLKAGLSGLFMMYGKNGSKDITLSFREL